MRKWENIKTMEWAVQELLRKVAKMKELERFKEHQESTLSPKPRVENFRKEEVIHGITSSRKIH